MQLNDKPRSGLPDDVRQPFITLLVIVVILFTVVFLRELAKPVIPPVTMTTLRVAGIDELEQEFDRHNYAWPPSEPVPRLAPVHLPTDLADLKVERKKAAFFRIVLPLILAENRYIHEQAEFIQRAFDHEGSLSHREQKQLARIAERYEVEGELSEAATREELLRRVDVIPVALALAQAANESAWGSSRFAVEGNNLFGVWTWQESKGITPRRRESGKKHLVRAYSDLRDSVRAYMHTLNTGQAYRVFRQKRREMRLDGKPLDPLALAGLLERYSERGRGYVSELRQIILGNELHRLNSLRLEG